MTETDGGEALELQAAIRSVCTEKHDNSLHFQRQNQKYRSTRGYRDADIADLVDVDAAEWLGRVEKLTDVLASHRAE